MHRVSVFNCPVDQRYFKFYLSFFLLIKHVFIGSVLYYLGCTTDRCRRCCGVRGEKRHGPPQHAPPPPPPMTDKFERYHHSGTTPEYHTIGGPWEPLKSTQTMTRPPDDPSLACYRQLVTHNGNGYKPPLPVRPHVVYV